MNYILKSTQGYRAKFFLLFLTVIGSTVTGAFFPYAIGKIVDEIFYKQQMKGFLISFFLYAGLYFVNQCLHGGLNYIWAKLKVTYVIDIRRQMFEHLLKLKAEIYNKIFPEMTLVMKERMLVKYSNLDIPVLQGYTAGELKERLHKDTENVAVYYEKRLEMWISVISILITTIILLYLNWILAAISFLLLPASFLITRFIKSRSNIQYEKRRQLQGKYNDFMIFNLFFWKEIKTNCSEGTQLEQFEEMWKNMGNAFLKSHIFWFLNRTFLAFKDVFLTKMGLYLLGGILVIKGMATVPILLTFMEYYSDFADRLLEVADNVMKRGEQEESIRRVEAILGLQEPVRPYVIESFEQMAFRNVTFSYAKEQEDVLQNFNIELYRGESVAIMGESGCGKSTLIKMMAGSLTPNQGAILWNGKNMDTIDRNSVYSKVGFLMQESNLFNLTIRENLLFGKIDATMEEMTEACRKANILEFIQTLSQGFETVIGENGIRLSGGQKHRLTIARLFLQNPEVIVFDEATSALDYQNESEILDLLLQNLEEKTFLMVTHRGTSVAKCNRVVYMA